MSTDILFQPFELKSLKLPNRLVMAPMTRGMAENGIPGPAQEAYYEKRARGGVGLILSEGTVIDRPASRNLPGIPFFHGEKPLSGWKGVIDKVHAAGGKMGPQIWHTGATKAEAPAKSTANPVSKDEPAGTDKSAEAKPRSKPKTSADRSKSQRSNSPPQTV